MPSRGTGYDFDASQYSPDGLIFQVGYARKAVDNSGTAVAMRGSDGVVLAVEKIRISKLHEETAGKRIHTVDRHVGVAISGLVSDGRQLCGIALDEATYYRQTYGSHMPLKELADKVAEYVHAYTMYSSLRPFGTMMMMASWTKEDGPQLYCIDPAGTCYGYVGMAAGKAAAEARTMVEGLKPGTKTCSELAKEAARIIHKLHDKAKDKAYDLELSWVTEGTRGVHQLVPKEVLEGAQQYAQMREEASEHSEEGEASRPSEDGEAATPPSE